MAASVPEAPIDRVEPRIPFFTPVITAGLERCWATNLSSGGMGVTAVVTSSLPARGDELELEFSLGESQKTVRVIGRVAWTSLLRPGGRIGFGLQFREVSAVTRAALARFLAQHRPRVIIALASAADQQLVRASLGDVDLDFVTGPEQLDEERLRSCASILVFDHDASKTKHVLETVWAQRSDFEQIPGEVPYAPITLCSAVDSDTLLPLITAGKLYEVIRPPLHSRNLALAIIRSCERWALQLELRWASLQLEYLAHSQQRVLSGARRDIELPRHNSNVVRESDAMDRTYKLISTVAVHDVPVLLLGETGTGKELAAREIHRQSKRANTPFVAQDCGALTETLLESELFGHVRGAFTGATSDHPGLFQIADGGTIFLDEIQNTSMALQARLLRVIEEGEVRPVGGSKTRQVNVRLIAACNVDLRQSVRDQRFRADFFYRLNRFPIELPPLREHTDDIVPLTRFFMTQLCQTLDRPLVQIDPAVERALAAYDWPGNIRELKNTIERALLLTPVGSPLRIEALPDELRGGAATADGAPSTGGLDEQVDRFERRIIETALARHQRVIRRAARELGVNAVTLSRKMRRLGIG